MIDPLPAELIEMMNKTGQALNDLFAPLGFTLFVFDKGNDGRMNYISNADRNDMIVALKEFIAVLEGRTVSSQSKDQH